jgi:hypothetical protein
VGGSYVVPKNNADVERATLTRALLRALALTAACVAFAAVSALVIAHLLRFNTQLCHDGLGIAAHPKPRSRGRGEVTLLPRDHVACSAGCTADLCGRDLSGADLTGNLEALLSASFDSETTWPPRLPLAFSPEHVMEVGKSPGLGLRDLHAQGITGRGVGVAIIGPALLVDHTEYAGRLRLYEELHCADTAATPYGAAAASLAVGRTVGVAPEAALYYIAETHTAGRVDPSGEPRVGQPADLRVIARSIERVRETNRRLPGDRKIRVIAIPTGWEPADRGYQDLANAVWAAEEEGIFVISASLPAERGLRFAGVAREPLDDPDDTASYQPPLRTRSAPLEIGAGPLPLLVPLDSRCMAAASGTRDYVFRREGKWNLMVPYLAGLYALCCQVRPDLTPERFWAVALETGDPVRLGRYGTGRPLGRLANPRRLVRALQRDQI